MNAEQLTEIREALKQARLAWAAKPFDKEAFLRAVRVANALANAPGAREALAAAGELVPVLELKPRGQVGHVVACVGEIGESTGDPGVGPRG